MLELTDSHCHIQSIGLTDLGEETTHRLWQKAGDITADQVVDDAAAAGVTSMVCVGCDVSDSQLAVEFVGHRPGCWAAIGIHPHEAQTVAGRSEQFQAFASLAEQPKVVAIGECGLDFYYHHSPKAAQIEVLTLQIELALKYNLPLIFHVRDAFDDFWPIFERYRGIRGVLHSFTDSADNLAKALERDLFIGVNGIATFTKDPVQQELYKTIPSSKLLLETDAPFLTPDPHRGQVNEPKYVAVIADFLADLRSEDRSELAATTTENACALFGI